MFKFQVITFEDHYHEAEWMTPKDYHPKPYIAQYCGWVTFETDTMIVLSQGRSVREKDEYDGHMHIIKQCVIKRKTIKF